MAKNQAKSDYNLLTCLSFITAYHGHARSAASLEQSLTSGSADGIGPETIIEAAQFAGFSAEIFIKEQLSDINAQLLPVIILTGQCTGLVLLEQKGATARIFEPLKHKEVEVDAADLDRAFQGKVIVFKREQNSVRAASLQDADQSKLSKAWFWAYFKDNMPIYRLVGIAALLINFFALTSPIFIMNMYDRVIPNAAIETGWALAIGALIVFSFDLLIRILRGRFIDLAGRRMDVLIGTRIFDQLLNIKLSERPQSSGVFASMLKEFDAVRDFFTSATIASLVDLPFALFFVAVIFFIAGPIAFVPLAVIIVILISSYILQIALKKDVLKTMRAGEERHGVLIETINGLETVKAIGADRRLRSLYTEHLGNMARYGENARYISNIGVSIANYAQQIMTVFIVIIGMYMVKDNALTMGALIAAVILSGRAVAPMGQFASLMARYYQTRQALETITTIMHKKVDRPKDKAFMHREHLKGAVAFNNVDFSYPQSGDNNRQILNNISFSIEHGEKVAIIGRIGSGKSTIARLMMGLYEPDNGQILIDHSDQTQIDPADLRRNFAYIAQDVTLFRGSIRDNITVSRLEATDEEILRAAEISGVLDFVKNHPMGLDAPVGESGQALSGGQRQAVALGRAMLTKPALYVCDEPTNAMDIQAENAFVRHIQGEVKEKTLILITHRLSLLSIVDRIIVVDQGQIVMDGPKADVIKAISADTNEGQS
jgi:ATP-binding cassette subfamily C protein LapB